MAGALAQCISGAHSGHMRRQQPRKGMCMITLRCRIRWPQSCSRLRLMKWQGCPSTGQFICQYWTVAALFGHEPRARPK
eukprot:2865725-Pyramimonas_sp.AAC.1